MTQFWQYKKRLSPAVPAVSTVGMQDDHKTWVLGKDIHIDATTGNLIPPNESQYVWLSHLCRGKGIASNANAVSIFLPLTTDGLLPLIEAIIVAMKHNSPAALMVLGSACIAMHYQTIVELNGECPAPLVCGDVGALSLFGCNKSRFYTKGTMEKYLLLLSKSTFPLGIDDPKKQDSVGELLVDLFNGGKSTTVTHGDIEPSSMGIITANFNLSAKAK